MRTLIIILDIQKMRKQIIGVLKIDDSSVQTNSSQTIYHRHYPLWVNVATLPCRIRGLFVSIPLIFVAFLFLIFRATVLQYLNFRDFCLIIRSNAAGMTESFGFSLPASVFVEGNETGFE